MGRVVLGPRELMLPVHDRKAVRFQEPRGSVGCQLRTPLAEEDVEDLVDLRLTRRLDGRRVHVRVRQTTAAIEPRYAASVVPPTMANERLLIPFS